MKITDKEIEIIIKVGIKIFKHFVKKKKEQ